MADAEGWVLDGLSLNDWPGTGVYRLTALSMPPPRKRPEWAEAADGDGALLVRDPLFENRTVEATVELRATSRDAAHTAVAAIVDKLQEASKNPLGIPLVWTPAQSTKSLTFYVLAGEVNEIPVTIESGYFRPQPVLQVGLTLTARPFGYGTEVSVASASGSGPLQIYSLASVTGDVAAEGRLIVSDTATQSRDFAAWGLEWRYQAGADLLLTQPDLTVTGFAGQSGTRAGSVSANIWRGTLTTTPVAVCGAGNQPHVGTFRVYARVYTPSTGVFMRLSYREGDGPLKSLGWEAVSDRGQDVWHEIDLGVISVPPKLLGTQRWTGQIEAYGGFPGDGLDVDYLLLIPAGEGFGRARRQLTLETSTTFSAADEFNQTAGALTGKTAWSGGVWAGAGDADDFSVNATTHSVQRTAVSDADVSTGRYAVSGAAAMTDMVVQVDYKRTGSLPLAGDQLRMGALARYVDTSNWLMAVVEAKATSLYYIRVVKRTTAGGVVELANLQGTLTQLAVSGAINSIRLAADTSGRWFVWQGRQGSLGDVPVLYGQHPDLATGGALASGKPGFYDAMLSTSTVTRNYDNFLAFVPAAQAACFSGQSIEFRSDDTLREDPTGTYWGRPQEYRGAPFYVPPAGDENRTSRVAVMLRRSDVYTLPNDQVADSQSVQVAYTPRYLAVPR